MYEPVYMIQIMMTTKMLLCQCYQCTASALFGARVSLTTCILTMTHTPLCCVVPVCCVPILHTLLCQCICALEWHKHFSASVQCVSAYDNMNTHTSLPVRQCSVFPVCQWGWRTLLCIGVRHITIPAVSCCCDMTQGWWQCHYYAITMPLLRHYLEKITTKMLKH